MSSAKKIGLFACTGVVAGNMMGSGIALLPANLASVVLLSGVGLSLLLVQCRWRMYMPDWQQKTRNKVAQLLMPEKFPLHLVFRQVFFITMLTGLVTWRLVLPRYLIFPPSSQY